MASDFIQLLRESLPEAIGGLTVAALLAGVGLFYRRLRRKKSETPEDSSTPLDEGKLTADWPDRKQTILVVDDDIEIISPAFRQLERDGFEIIAATNVSQAMSILESEQSIDLIVTDLIMPFGDAKHGEAIYTGLEVIQAARRIRGKVPIICFSVVHSRDIKEQLQELEVNEFLSKPTGIFELTERVKLVLALVEERPREELVQDEINRRKHELKSNHSHTRIRALWALGELGHHSPNILVFLEDIAQSDSDYYVRRAANQAIRKIHSNSK